MMLRQTSQCILGDTLEEVASVRRPKDSEHCLGKKEMGRDEAWAEDWGRKDTAGLQTAAVSSYTG